MRLRQRWPLPAFREGAYRGLVAGGAAGLLIGTAILPIIDTMIGGFVGVFAGLLWGALFTPVVALVVRLTSDPQRISRRSQIALGTFNFVLASIVSAKIALGELHKRGDLTDLVPGYTFSAITGVISTTLVSAWYAPLVARAIVPPEAEMRFEVVRHHATFAIVYVLATVLVAIAWTMSGIIGPSFYYNY